MLRIISGSLVVVLMILAGLFFVFGDEVLRVVDDLMSSEGKSNLENIVWGEGIEDGGAGEVEDLSAGESDSAGLEESGCNMQQIQYSLKNFENSVECTDTGINGCISLVVSCSMEVYSFEDGEGIFGIRYALVDSNEIELDFELIEKEVVLDTHVLFSTEFIRSDVSGVDMNLTCPFSVETIPLREICN